MNQNLLIVDDEREILSWLEELFRCEFEQEIGVYSACSAREALKLLNQIRFDVVLTDIRMPGMDGISLFKRIKENWPRCKVVFLTGYRNFEDIYQIINHKDVRYVLKSEDDQRIMGAVQELLTLCQNEMEKQNQEAMQKEKLKKAKYWMQRELMQQLCAGITVEQMDQQMKELEIPIDIDRKMLLYLLRLDGYQEEFPKCFAMEESLRKMIQTNMAVFLKVFLYTIDKQQILVFVQPKEAREDWETMVAVSSGMLEYVQEIFRNTWQATFSAVIDAKAVGVSEIPMALRSRKVAMIGKIGGAEEMIIRMDEENSLEDLGGKYVGFSSGKISELRFLLELRKQKEYFSCLGECLKEMMQKKSRHDARALEIYCSIAIMLLQFINETHLNEPLAFRTALYKLTRADIHENWLEAAEYLTEVSQAVFCVLDDNDNTLAKKALKRVSSYIEEHLEEDLSLSTLAAIGGFNASYLSRLFKQVFGEGINGFITKKRMELAQILLADSNRKIQDIAVKTGYLSTHSFSRAFRNETGISPSEFRAMKLEEKQEMNKR